MLNTNYIMHLDRLFKIVKSEDMPSYKTLPHNLINQFGD